MESGNESKSAVLFVVFNRKDTAESVFNQIRLYKPDRLYIASDGPRVNIPGEREIVLILRSSLLSKIDWSCDIHTLFRDENIGCGKGVSDAISWFFEHEESGIILEDDCLPSPQFFSYCSQMLAVYRDNKNIFCIGGFNKSGYDIVSDDILFTKYVAIWGWATWRREWQEFSNFQHYLAEIRKKRLHYKWFPLWEAFLRMYAWRQFVTTGRSRNIWDFGWFISCLYNEGLTILPVANLIVNVGVGDARGTNTQKPMLESIGMKFGHSSGVMNIPAEVLIDEDYERKLRNVFFRQKIRAIRSKIFQRTSK